MFYRGYDPATGRMNQIDPMAASYHDYLPYHYALNNPVMVNDSSGASANNPWGSASGVDNNGARLQAWSDMLDGVGYVKSSAGGGGSGRGGSWSGWYNWSQSVSEDKSKGEADLIAMARAGDVNALNSTHGSMVKKFQMMN